MITPIRIKQTLEISDETTTNQYMRLQAFDASNADLFRGDVAIPVLQRPREPFFDASQ